MKLLITGGAGYIGSVITNMALQNQMQVKVIDCLWFNQQIPLIHLSNPNYEFIKGDICDTTLHDSLLHDVDMVIHCAAVVGDPASKLFPELTKKINYQAAIALFKKAVEKQKKGFIFFSTCSNYGVAQGMATENSELKPLSLYAETKVHTEQYIIENHKNLDFIICRLSTVYGVSPRMRFDLTVNDFTLNAYRKKYLDIFLPESYRPYIHVFDLASTIIQLILNFDKTKNNVFNLGFTGENYMKIEIADAVQKHISGVKVDILKEGGDLRDYKVDFSKLQSYLGCKNIFNVEKSVNEIVEVLNSEMITDYDNPVYYNTTPNIQTN
ncbi:MAG: NAD(P)-dependent oxidoreductase [Bacteroidota bacterium]